MSHTFENQVVLLTGGSTGIGAATARLLAGRGAKVVITGRHENPLRTAAEQHPNISSVTADIARPADAARSVQETLARHARIDVLINNAAILETSPLSDVTTEHARRLLDVNVLGLIETTRLALPHLRASSGNIVNVTTVAADQPFANMSVYCASKAAVLALTRSWAQELGGEGLRVNAVSPGPIETPMFSPEKLGLSAAQVERLGASILPLVPAKRFGKPEEVAEVIAFVASRAASFVNGAQYSVGGGIEA